MWTLKSPFINIRIYIILFKHPRPKLKTRTADLFFRNPLVGSLLGRIKREWHEWEVQKFLEGNPCVLLPAHWVHMTSGTRAGEGHTFGLEQGKTVRLSAPCFVGKYTPHKDMSVCAYISNNTRVRMHGNKARHTSDSCLVCKAKGQLVETAMITGFGTVQLHEHKNRKVQLFCLNTCLQKKSLIVPRWIIFLCIPGLLYITIGSTTIPVKLKVLALFITLLKKIN